MNRTLSIESAFDYNNRELKIVGDVELEDLASYNIGHTSEWDEKAGDFVNTTYLENTFKSNLSSVYTTLIQNAGRWCERFASDILIDIDQIKKAVDDPLEALGEETHVRKSFLSGFRMDGVDHESFIQSQVKSKGHGIYDYYRSIYEVVIDITKDESKGRYGKVDVKYAINRLH